MSDQDDIEELELGQRPGESLQDYARRLERIGFAPDAHRQRAAVERRLARIRAQLRREGEG